MPSSSPSSAWSRGWKSNAGGSPTRLISIASSSVKPSGADSCGTFGVRASRSFRSASACSSSGSSVFSLADTSPTSAISRCFSSPCALPIALLARFCSARSSSTCTVSSRRRRSSSSKRSIASARSRLARPLRNGSGSSRIARMSSTSDLGRVRRLGGGPLVRLRYGLARLSGLLVHDRLSLEDAALLHDERLGGDVPVDTAAARELRAALHVDRTFEPPGHHHVLRPDVGLDLALWRQQHVALGVDLALHLPVDAQRPRRDHRALELGPLADDRDLTALISHPSHLRPSSTRRLRFMRARRAGLLGDILRHRLVTTPYHVAVTARCVPASRACRIASSSSIDRL